MEPSDVVTELWARIQARDWDGVGALVADDVVVDWPISAERFVGRANYVRMNAEYPEGWSIRVLGVIAQGDEVVSEVEVPHAEMGVHRVVSFWTVRDSHIAKGREYWVRPGSEPSPESRAHLVTHP